MIKIPFVTVKRADIRFNRETGTTVADASNPSSPGACVAGPFFNHSSRTGKNMTFTVQYWHWLVFGMILIMAEIFVPSFTIFWFGLGGLVVAGLLLLFSGISFTWQLF